MYDIAIIGGGITGLFTAATATARGNKVVCLEAGSIPGEQSHGEGRIFRVAHSSAALCESALVANELWASWERISGVHMLSRHGQASAFPNAPQWLTAMHSVDADAELIEPKDIHHVRLADGVPVLWDPAAATIHTGNVTAWLLRFLGSHLRQHTPVVDAERHRDSWTLITPDDHIEARHVIACGGVHLPKLGALFGVDVPTSLSTARHVRFTFGWRGDSDVPCVSDLSHLGQPAAYSLLTKQGFSIGMTGPDVEPVDNAMTDSEFFDVNREACDAYRKQYVPNATDVVTEVVDYRLPYTPLFPDGDGWKIFEGDNVRLLLAVNAYKLAPYLAEHLLKTTSCA